MTDPLDHTDNDRAHERLHIRVDAVTDRVTACEVKTAQCRGEVETHMASMGAHLAQAGVQLTRTTELVEQTATNLQAIEKSLVQVLGRMDSLARRDDDIMAIALEARSLGADLREKTQPAIEHASTSRTVLRDVMVGSLMVVIGAVLGALLSPVLSHLF